MVKAHNSGIFPPHSTWKTPNFNCMSASLEPPNPGCLPEQMNPGNYGYTFFASMAMPGFTVPTFPSLNVQHNNEAHGLPQCLPYHFQNSLPVTGPYLKENKSMFSYGLGREAIPHALPGCQRRFVAFDHPFQGYYVHNEEYAAEMGRINVTKPKLQEESDENHLSIKESQMHEDTEDINALLYSDDDYDINNDSDDDDDEVASTGHSPILISGSSGMQEPVGEVTDELASSIGPNKRQKLLNGWHKKSSVVDFASSVKVEGTHGYDDDAESSHAIGYTREGAMVSILYNKQLRKAKIRATMKILESIIPGAKDKDPLMVLVRL